MSDTSTSLLGNSYTTKKESFLQGGSNLYFVLSVITLVVAGVLWGGLWLWSNSVQSNLEKTEKQIAEINASRDKELEKKLVNFDNQLSYVSTLLDDHIVYSKALSELFKYVQPTVRLESFDADSENGTYHFSGVADSFITVAKQLVSFESYDAIKEIKLGSISENDGLVSFDMTLTLDKGKIILENFVTNE